MEKKGIVGKIVEDLKESTRAVHEINKANIAAVNADTRANFEAASTPDPGFERFMEAEGIGNKAKVVIDNIKEGARENSQKEKERRAEIRNHGSYQTLLEEQQVNRQAMIRGHKKP